MKLFKAPLLAAVGLAVLSNQASAMTKSEKVQFNNARHAARDELHHARDDLKKDTVASKQESIDHKQATFQSKMEHIQHKQEVVQQKRNTQQSHQDHAALKAAKHAANLARVQAHNEAMRDLARSILAKQEAKRADQAANVVVSDGAPARNRAAFEAATARHQQRVDDHNRERGTGPYAPQPESNAEPEPESE